MAFLLLDSLIAMCGNEAATARLVEIDVDLSRVETIPIEVTRAGARKNVVFRLRLLRRQLSMPVLLLGSAVIAAWFFGHYAALVRLPGSQLGALSAFVFACAGMGRLGYGGQSYGGVSSVERADVVIFQLLCWVGMYLAAVAAL